MGGSGDFMGGVMRIEVIDMRIVYFHGNRAEHMFTGDGHDGTKMFAAF
jgi:hypothetical protein